MPDQTDQAGRPDQHEGGAPWGVTPEQSAPRRKVAWGSGASYDETSAPRPRLDAPASPPVFGDAFGPVTLADDETAGDTAWLHAGVPTDRTQTPDVAVAAPVDAEAAAAQSTPDLTQETIAQTSEAAETSDAWDASVAGDAWMPPAVPAVGCAIAGDGGPVDLASVFDDMFEDEPSPADQAGPITPAGQAGMVDAPDATHATEVSFAPQRPDDVAGSDADAEPTDNGGLGDLFAVDDTDTPDTEPASDTDTLVPTEPARSAPVGTANPDSPSAQPDAAPTPRGRLNLAARRAALEAARQVTAADVAAVRPDQQLLRYAQSEQLYLVVDRILGLGRGGDPELQAMIKRLELTRDKDLDRAQRSAYQAMLEPRLATAQIQIANAADRDVIFDIAYDELLGIGPLGPLWRDDSVDEIMVSGPDKVTVERSGRLELTPVRFRNQAHLEQTSRTLAGISGDDRAVSSTNPLVTVQLPRARVQFVWRPLAVSKVAIAIRKFGDLMDMGQLLSFGSLTEEMATFLHDAVTARATILVSGGTGSGKTTFINAVSEFIPDTERVITIEDALELQLRNTHIERLVTKEASSADDTMLFGQDQLLKASLRMRPDRIIVGEIRDGKGCSVMLEAANTGHDGTMTTVHANSPELALQRMATLLRRVESMPDDVAKAEVGTAINVIVQVVRKRGRRFVSHISFVDQAVAVTGQGNLVTHLFTGEFPASATEPVFARVGGIRPDTDLAIKMTDAGLDPGMWE